MAVWGFVFHFSKQRQMLCAMKTGHTRDIHTVEGGVRTPVGNIPSPWKPSPWGSLCPRNLTEGSTSSQRPSQLRQSPFWKETGIFTKHSKHCRKVNTAQAQHCGPKTSAMRPREAPRPPHRAGLFGSQGWERPAGVPEAPREAKCGVSGNGTNTDHRCSETPSLRGDPGPRQE